tara:strand:+ start:159 stop:323 length:165 start_codon:yes stop_codon:yes gene_type:complete
MLMAPDETPAKVLKSVSPSEEVAVALLLISKLIERLVVVPPIEIAPEVTSAIIV